MLVVDSPAAARWWAVAPFGPLEAQLRSATGRLVGRSLENELGSLNPWSVGLGVEHWDSPLSEGGEGESPGPPPPTW